jgi:hypothetical protein
LKKTNHLRGGGPKANLLERKGHRKAIPRSENDPSQVFFPAKQTAQDRWSAITPIKPNSIVPNIDQYLPDWRRDFS